MSALPSTRGRPSADRIAEIEHTLLEAALELFTETGYEATSMEAVAARAKVSKGTLYARYSGKEALFRAMLDRETALWSERAGAEDHLMPPEIGARLRHHARMLMTVFGWPDFQRISMLVNSVAPLFPDLVLEWHRIGTVHYLDYLANDLATAAKAEGYSFDDCRLVASVLLHSLTSWYRSEAIFGAIVESRALHYADQVSDLLLHSLEQASGQRR